MRRGSVLSKTEIIKIPVVQTSRVPRRKSKENNQPGRNFPESDAPKTAPVLPAAESLGIFLDTTSKS